MAAIVILYQTAAIVGCAEALQTLPSLDDKYPAVVRFLNTSLLQSRNVSF